MNNGMANEFYSGYQYDRCASRGICSINPATSALQEVIFIFLRRISYYGQKLLEKKINDKRIKTLVLNTISVLSSNYEISEINFKMIFSAFKIGFPLILNDYKDVFAKEEISEADKLFSLGENMNDYIRFGEKEFNSRTGTISSDERSLYGVLFILVKSIGINIMTCEQYGECCGKSIGVIYKAFNLLNSAGNNKEELKDVIYNIAEADCRLIKKIRELQEKKYGIQSEAEISYSSEKGKAMLVVGSELSELERILDTFSEEEVDIYTHDNMILAHTFPKFREYKHLKGQFGQGMESCLLDFSTFPGPIILTKNSLFNVESLYRGRLFSTDIAYSKGVIPVKDNDFSAVLTSVKESKGFKRGKKCISGKIGFSFADMAENIDKTLSSGKYQKSLIVGYSGYTAEEKEYFNLFFNHLSDEILTITMSDCEQKEGKICLNSCADNCSFLRISEEILKNENIKTSIFIPYSDRHTLSIMIYLSTFKNVQIFAGKWNQKILSQGILEPLVKEFGILEITSPKKDLSTISDF